MKKLENLNKTEYHNELVKYCKKMGHINLDEVKNADWTDRHRFPRAIPFEEIALYLLITDEYIDDLKITHLKESNQKTIKKIIDRYLKDFENHYKTIRIEDLISSESFEEFKINFRKSDNQLNSNKDVYNFNDYINFFGTKKSNIQVSYEELQDLKYIAYTLYNLEKSGITPQTYNDKVKTYIKFVKDASTKYGLLIYDDIPFSNPSKLYIIMDAKLSKYGFSNKQKRQFYIDFNIKGAIPTQKLSQKRRGNDRIRELGDKFRTLTKEDQLAAEQLHPEIKTFELEDEKYDYSNYTFSQRYYEILEEYNIDKFPLEAIDPYYHINTDYNLTESPWEIDNLNINEEKYLFKDDIQFKALNNIEKLDQLKYAEIRSSHLSLRYPDYKVEQEKRLAELERDIAYLCDDSHLIKP